MKPQFNKAPFRFYMYTHFYADNKLEQLTKKSKQRAKPRQAVPDQGSDDDDDGSGPGGSVPGYYS